MTPSFSPFQTLPTLVIDMIIEYLVGHPRASDSFKQILNESYGYYLEKSFLAQLTTVSSVWRLAALSLICDTCEISDSGSEGGFEVKFPAWRRYSACLLLHTTHLVKRVMSTIRCYRINGDSAIAVQTRPGYGTLSFPSATTFGLTLAYLDDYSGVRRFRTGTRLFSCVDFRSDTLVKLAQSHMRLAPAAVNVEVSVLYHGRPGSGAEYLCDVITSILCKGRARRLDVSSRRDGSPVWLTIYSVPVLTTITSGPNDTCTSFVMLAYLNSPSLTSLRAKIQHKHDWLDLVYGDTNVPAVFTCLKTLSLDITDVEYDHTWVGVKDVEMFPSLSSLEVTGAYPFVDDLLFRGNGASLQTLHVPFKTIATNILGELGILERAGVTRMKRIRFGEVAELDEKTIANNGRKFIAQQLYRIMDVATSLCLSSDGPDYEVYRAMINTPCVTNIQHLDIREVTYRHDHVIRVIRALPNLVSFTAEITHNDIHGDVPDHYKNTNDLHKKFYPLSSVFRTLRVLNTSEYSSYRIAREAIRIAIVCKNPVQVHVPQHELESFKGAVSEAIASDEFAPYADSLCHLI